MVWIDRKEVQRIQAPAWCRYREERCCQGVSPVGRRDTLAAVPPRGDARSEVAAR